MDQSRGLERLPRGLASHAGARQPPQLAVDYGQELFGRRPVAASGVLEQTGDLVGRSESGPA